MQVRTRTLMAVSVLAIAGVVLALSRAHRGNDKATAHRPSSGAAPAERALRASLTAGPSASPAALTAGASTGPLTPQADPEVFLYEREAAAEHGARSR